MRIDFHSHILPGMDDGASNVGESLEILRALGEAKLDTVILTPHFYRQKEDIEGFLKRREASLRTLSAAISELTRCPKLLTGAEVYFYPSLSSDPGFEKLCIEGTNYILLELPFEKFHENFYGEYNAFINRCNKKIILAHIERYLEFGNTPEDFRRLLSYGDTICQMNCGAVARAGFFERKKLLSLIGDGLVSVLGTDAHNMEHRPPMFGKAESVIVNKCGDDTFRRLCENGEKVLTNQ